MREMTVINSKNYFDKIKNYKKIILFGCGGKGRQAIGILERLGVNISAACDNNIQLWGKEFLPNIYIKSLDEIADEISIQDSCFLITSSIMYAIEIEKSIQEKCFGVDVYHLCNPFKVEQTLITDAELQFNLDKLNLQYDFLEDEMSRRILAATVDSKVTGNMLPLLEYTSGRSIDTFFDSEFIPINENNVYLDVGAYTGDTIQSFLMFSGGKYSKIIGIEADKGNFSSLCKFVKYGRVPNIDVYNVGLWDREENRFFFTNDKNDSINYDSPNLFLRVDELADNLSLNQMNGKLKEDIIHLTTLDEITKNISPTIIKINALAADNHIISGGGK